MITKFTTVLLACLVTNLAICQSTKAEEIVYQKQLSKQQSLTVSRHEIPYVPPQITLPPGGTMPVPDKTYLYSFSISNGKTQEVWWTRVYHAYGFGGHQLSRMQIFDAALEGETFILLYKNSGSGFTIVNILYHSPKAPPQEMPGSDKRIIQDSDAKPIVVNDGKLSGSLKYNSLSVTLKNIGPRPYHFYYKNKTWVRDPADLQPPSEQNKGVPDPKNTIPEKGQAF